MITAVLLNFIDLFVLAANVLIIARVIFSWLPDGNRFDGLRRTVYEITDPILAPVRQLMPRNSMLDLSPLITLVILNIAQTLLHSLLLR